MDKITHEVYLANWKTSIDGVKKIIIAYGRINLRKGIDGLSQFICKRQTIRHKLK